MQIYLTGTHNSGKTTLARVLSEKIGLYRVPEIALELLWLKNTEKWGWKELPQCDHVQFQTSLYFWFKHLQSKRCFISDRSLIDVLAYTSYVNEIKVTEPILKPIINQLLEELLNPVNHDLRHDTIYVYCIADPKDDDPAYEVISDKIRTMLNIFGINYLVYSLHSYPDPADFVDELIANGTLTLKEGRL